MCKAVHVFVSNTLCTHGAAQQTPTPPRLHYFRCNAQRGVQEKALADQLALAHCPLAARPKKHNMHLKGRNRATTRAGGGLRWLPPDAHVYLIMVTTIMAYYGVLQKGQAAAAQASGMHVYMYVCMCTHPVTARGRAAAHSAARITRSVLLGATCNHQWQSSQHVMPRHHSTL